MGAIEALSQRFQRGETGPEEAAAAMLAHAGEPAAHAVFTQLLREYAQEQAQASAERWKRGRPLGPLDGIPVTWKDLFDIAGLPTTSGSLLASRAPAMQDAAAVSRLHAAGVVSLGKTNLSEFAFSGLGLNPHFGTPLQKAHRTGALHLVGGSSSGAAAAMRLGIGCVALGTDTSGSIRVPAAWSGLVGFRPSQGRYPVAGVAALAPSLDTVGIIAATVADVLCVDAVLQGDARTKPFAAQQPHFILVDQLCGPQVQASVRDNCLRLMRRLSNAGMACEQRHVESFDIVAQAFALHGTLVAAEAGHTLARYTTPESLAQLDPFVRHRLMAARAAPARDRLALLQLREAMLKRRAAAPANAIYVFPTTPASAPALSSVQTLDRITAANSAALRHTMPGSFLDMPGIAVPSGCDEAGLPTSVLLSCPRGGDAMLLAVARKLELLEILCA
ncbi:MAG TPA: amidase family protein [Burkholderiaceae bacterium]|nr:amidase family protein [Burkholderiaceae bacterium]